jgi:hypothetical protein
VDASDRRRRHGVAHKRARLVDDSGADLEAQLRLRAEEPGRVERTHGVRVDLPADAPAVGDPRLGRFHEERTVAGSLSVADSAFAPHQGVGGAAAPAGDAISNEAASARATASRTPAP